MLIIALCIYLYDRGPVLFKQDRLTIGGKVFTLYKFRSMVVDAEKDLLLDVLPLKPFLIKPNNHELGQMFGRKLKTEDEIIECAKELQDRGAVNVLVSMAGDGALLVAEDGHIYKEGVCRGTVKNSVGAGDSMVAGFLAGYLEKGDYEYALKLGTASGGATAFSYGIGTKELIMELLGQLQ